MTKKIYIIIAVVVVIAIAGFAWWSTMKKEEAPEMRGAAESVDTTDAIQKDISNINVGNVETEFKGVDETIKAL
jgi:predicted negative regulator of RcsB-dependent stress response